MGSYDTLSEAMNELKKQGYTEDFNIKHDCLICKDGTIKVFKDDFVVDKFFRFEGDTDPADEAILYAISSPKNNVKGILVNGYGIYSEPMANELVEKLKTHK
ncbi:MAG TPA: phosphoribosylpyrophosphate synthetase [Bacteroidia bacterium]|jgi:hypothetical protein|nr:phosphoribosylpyrophosphate synthetase [Bacteroidia bacterium]